MKEMLMGIENEFVLAGPDKSLVDAQSAFPFLRDRLNVPYFVKAETALRLPTGGAFYIDDDAPEITTAPYFLEKGAVTAVTTNLLETRNMIVKAVDSLNKDTLDSKGHPLNRTLYLQGYSAHYNFSFPEIEEGQRQRDICRLLALTVNPAIQLLTENRMSSGIMFRDREGGRFEICADYIPGMNDTIAAVGFQAAMFSTIRSWVVKGIWVSEMERLLHYANLVTPDRVSTRTGYISKTPEVISQGRRAKLAVIKPSGRVVTKTAQQLLMHYSGIFEEEMDKVLTKGEKRIVMDSVHQRRNLPIDRNHYPKGYLQVRDVKVDESLAEAPLRTAFGNAVTDRLIFNDILLKADSMFWEKIGYTFFANTPQDQVHLESITVSLDNLVEFEILIGKDRELFRKIISGKLNSDERQLLIGRGFEDYQLSYLNLSSELSYARARGFSLENFLTESLSNTSGNNESEQRDSSTSGPVRGDSQ